MNSSSSTPPVTGRSSKVSLPTFNPYPLSCAFSFGDLKPGFAIVKCRYCYRHPPLIRHQEKHLRIMFVCLQFEKKKTTAFFFRTCLFSLVSHSSSSGSATILLYFPRFKSFIYRYLFILFFAARSKPKKRELK